MDFSPSPRARDLVRRIDAFVEAKLLPLEADPAYFGPGDHLVEDRLQALRKEAQAAGLWAFQAPTAMGGLGLDIGELAHVYEAAGRALFGPLVFNAAAPDDGNIYVLSRLADAAQQERWLRPLVAGRARSAIAMTEPAPGAGSDPAGMMRTTAMRDGEDWIIRGRKWFITGAGVADHFILLARTAPGSRHSLTAFLFDRAAPGWRIERLIPVMGPEEPGGHGELVFEDLRIPDSQRLLGIGEGMKVVQTRLGYARLTHCFRWLGLARRSLEIAAEHVGAREAFGQTLAGHEGVQWMLGEAAREIQAGRLLSAMAAWRLDRGERARPEVSMAKIAVADALHKAVDTAIQLLGAKGYSKDTKLEWIYRYARQARLVDGASEVHKMVLARELMAKGRDFWSWA